MEKQLKKELSRNAKKLTDFLKNKKILKIKQFKPNEILIVCEDYRFYIDCKENGKLEFSITENIK